MWATMKAEIINTHEGSNNTLAIYETACIEIDKGSTRMGNHKGWYINNHEGWNNTLAIYKTIYVEI